MSEEVKIFNIDDKVRVIDVEDMLKKHGHEKLIGKEGTVIYTYTSIWNGTIYYEIDTIIDDAIHPLYLEKLSSKLTMTQDERIKCISYQTKNMCGKYCEMLQDGKCEKYGEN